MMLERLRKANSVKIYSVFDDEFKPYGRVISGFDFSELANYFDKNTEIPESGNVYVPDLEGAHNISVSSKIENEIYGGMPIEIGYCNGKNTTYNGFEYHKCSEVNIALTDFCLVLGHIWQISDNKFYVGNEKVFFVPQKCAVELYQTTLHLSPCRVTDDGFKAIVILANGTNTPLENKPQNNCAENALLLMKNKWIIAHPERKPLIDQGAYPGLIGENKEIHY